MPDLFHFTHDSRHISTPAAMDRGTVLRTSERRSNPYFESVLGYHHVLPLRGISQPILEVLRSPAIHQLSSYDVGTNCAHIIESQFRVIREYEFEEIRRVEFPHLPSRMRCVCLTDRAGVPYWRQRLSGRANQRLLRVSADGDLHAAHEGHLSVEVQSSAEVREAARRYWRGEAHPNGHFEILFEGELTVLEIVDVDSL